MQDEIEKADVNAGAVEAAAPLAAEGAAPAADYSGEHFDKVSPEEQAEYASQPGGENTDTGVAGGQSPSPRAGVPASALSQGERGTAALPQELTALGFRDAGQAAQFVQAQEHDRTRLAAENAQLQARLSALEARGNAGGTPAPQQQQLQAPVKKALPKTLSEAIGADWNAEFSRDPVGTMLKMNRVLREHDEEMPKYIEQHVQPHLKPLQEFKTGYENNYKTYEQQAQAAQEQQRFAGHVTQLETEFSTANPDFALPSAQNPQGGPLAAAMHQWLKANASWVAPAIKSNPSFNPFPIAAAHIRATNQAKLSQARAGAATSRMRQTGALANTARPGASAVVAPAQGRGADEETIEEFQRNGWGVDVAEAANRSAQRAGL